MNFESVPSLDPLQYGYELKDDLLSPTRLYIIFPENLVFPCTCKVCGTSRCRCKSNGIPCCEYCYCRTQTKECKNDAMVIRSIF